MLSTLLGNLRDLWHREPARITAATVAVVVFAASQFHVVLDPLSVTQYVLLLGGILLGGEGTRTAVAPIHKLAHATVVASGDDQGDAGHA